MAPEPRKRAVLTFEVGDSNTQTYSKVDTSEVTERWIGEHNIHRVRPVIENINYQWTIEGSHIYDYEIGAIGKVHAMEAADYQKDFVEHFWMEPSNGAVWNVKVDVTLDGKQGSRTAKYEVKAPLISVLINLDETNWDPPVAGNLWTTKYFLGEGGATEDPADDVPGIAIDLTYVDGPSGTMAVAQLMDWTTDAHFGGDPTVLHADPNTGPGDYTFHAEGLDTAYPLVQSAVGANTSLRFTDSPIISFFGRSAGPGGTLDHNVDFKTYILWASDRALSIPATVRRVDWTWAFTASTLKVDDVWRWDGATDASTSSGGIITSDILEWEEIITIGKHKFKPVF
jgi:hypothetical protein